MGEIKKCKICERLKSNKVYTVQGSWVDLDIYKIHGETKIQAYGDGIAEMNINYCPECGRKLKED